MTSEDLLQSMIDKWMDEPEVKAALERIPNGSLTRNYVEDSKLRIEHIPPEEWRSDLEDKPR